MEQFSPTRLARFWSSIEKTDTCWLWHGPIGKVTGYGSLGHFTVHRYSYELLRGPIPKGMQIDHICRVRACVNPDHLEVVTPRENYLRGISPPAINARKTHCIRGHEYTPENTGRQPEGWRFCKTCHPMTGHFEDEAEARRAYWRAAYHNRSVEYRLGRNKKGAPLHRSE